MNCTCGAKWCIIRQVCAAAGAPSEHHRGVGTVRGLVGEREPVTEWGEVTVERYDVSVQMRQLMDLLNMEPTAGDVPYQPGWRREWRR